MFACSTEIVDTGTPETVPAEHFLGVKLKGGSAASTVSVYNKSDATAASKLVGYAACAANGDSECMPHWPVPTDQEGDLHVVVTGTGASAILYYSPRITL